MQEKEMRGCGAMWTLLTGLRWAHWEVRWLIHSQADIQTHSLRRVALADTFSTLKIWKWFFQKLTCYTLWITALLHWHNTFRAKLAVQEAGLVIQWVVTIAYFKLISLMKSFLSVKIEARAHRKYSVYEKW